MCRRPRRFRNRRRHAIGPASERSDGGLDVSFVSKRGVNRLNCQSRRDEALQEQGWTEGRTVQIASGAYPRRTAGSYKNAVIRDRASALLVLALRRGDNNVSS